MIYTREKKIIKDLESLRKSDGTIKIDDEIRYKIQIIIQHCNKKYADQGYYGHAALNRKILLDPIIADNLTAAVIPHVMSDQSELTQLIRITKNSEMHFLPLSDVIINAIIEGLNVIESLPNNEKEYSAQSRIQQKTNFHDNTTRILNAIQIASKRAEPYSVDSLRRPTVARYFTLLDTLDSIKNSEGVDNLLKMTGYTADEINNQMNNAFSRLCLKLSVTIAEKKLDEFCELFLEYKNGDMFLDGDISHCFYDRLHFTAALISDKQLHFSNGVFSYKNIFQKLIELINQQPGSYPIAEEQISLRLGLIELNLVNNFSNTLEEIKLKRQFLEQGPVEEKNKAHQDVEYILYSLMEVEFPIQLDENGNISDTQKEYLALNPSNLTTTISFNSLQQVNISCPNGKTYNLSCALRNANLSYFRLLSEKHEKLLSKLDAKPGSSATPLNPIYQIEESAIRDYTDNSSYSDMNALLRGLPVSITKPSNIKELILKSLLAISFVNKHVDNDPNSRPSRTIVRLTDNLPIDMTSQMMMPLGFSHLSGLTSFSFSPMGAEFFRKRAISIIINDQSGRLSIERLSHNPSENEVPCPPGGFVFKSVYIKDGRIMVEAEILNGPINKKFNRYLSESALIYFYEVRSSLTLSAQLSEMTRKMTYVKSIVDYLGSYAKNEIVRQYCLSLSLSHHELEIIKAVVVLQPLNKKQGTNHTEDFDINNGETSKIQSLERTLSLSSAEIEYYFNINEYTETEIHSLDLDPHNSDEDFHKSVISLIITLANWLDLPKSLDAYNYQKLIQAVQSNEKIIEISELQDAAFQQLQKIAINCILKTGGQLAQGYESSANNENNNEHLRCNKDVFYCIEQCEHAKLLSKLPEKQKLNFGHVDNISRLNQVIRRNINFFKSKVPDVSVFLKLELNADELKSIFDICIANLEELTLTISDMKALFEIPVISSEQRKLFLNSVVLGETEVREFFFTFFQMGSFSEKHKEFMLNGMIKKDALSMSDLKILFESNTTAPHQKDNIIDFYTRHQKGSSVCQTLFLFEFNGITENQKQIAINNFIDSIENNTTKSDASNFREFLDLLDPNQKKLLFINLSKSSKDIFFRLAPFLSENEMTIYLSIWIKTLPDCANLKNNNSALVKNAFIESFAFSEQLKFLMDCEGIEKEYRLLIFLSINNKTIFLRYFEQNDPTYFPPGMLMSLQNLKILHDNLTQLKDFARGYWEDAVLIKEIIENPLDVEKLNSGKTSMNNRISGIRNSKSPALFYIGETSKADKLTEIQSMLESYINALPTWLVADVTQSRLQ